MSPEQWETVRRSADDLRRERDCLRTLLNDALAFVPTDHPTWAASRKALGLTTERAAA